MLAGICICMGSGDLIHSFKGVYLLEVHLYEVCTSDCFRKSESDRERSSMLLLFCRVFITVRGPALIMHGYMAPQASKCFTGGEKKQYCKMALNGIEKVLSLTQCVRLSIYLLSQPAIYLYLFF